MTDQNLAAGRTAPLLKEFKQQQLQKYSSNDRSILLDRQMRLSRWFNRSAFQHELQRTGPTTDPVL
jgi:hypothetical protein